MPFVNILILSGNQQVAGTTSDFDGKFKFINIPAGEYDLKATMVGYTPYFKKKIKVRLDSVLTVNITMESNGVSLDEVQVIQYAVPLIDHDKTSVGAPKKTKAVQTPSTFQTPPTRVEETNLDYQAGQLTASELNDFSKWDLWKDIEANDLKEMQKLWRLSPDNRYSVQVKGNNNKPVVDAEVQLLNSAGSVIWKTRTDNTGKAELWGSFGGSDEKAKSLRVKYNNTEYNHDAPHPFKEGINVMLLPVECNRAKSVDIMFVVDATGSMNDEIRYLKSELNNIISTVKENNPAMKTRTASVFYCADGNSQETYSSDFSNEPSVTSDFVSVQNHGCGGEEAVDKALETAVNLNWSESSHARIMFMILDAPPYRDEETVAQLQAATRKAAEKGIRVVPVVCSAEEMSMALPLEYIMRSIALATNGTYVFLTDHSNIGNAHATPVTDSYDVEYLNDLIKRIINQYTYSTPCDLIVEQGISDTTVVFAKEIIAHEVVDSTRAIASAQPGNIIVDLRPKPDANLQDSTAVQATVDNNNNNQSGNPDNAAGTEVNNIPVAPGIKYFPNPTTGEITVLTTGDIKELMIFDISGKLLQIVKAEPETHISLANYSSGIYFIRFSANGSSMTGKIILQ